MGTPKEPPRPSAASAGPSIGPARRIARLRRFAVLLGCFLAGLFLFDRLACVAMRGFAQHLYQNSDFENQMARYLARQRYDGLILGTSRAFEGINAVYLNHSQTVQFFKESFVGKGPKYNFFFYQLFKRNAGVPRLVLYVVDYFVYDEDSIEQWFSRFRFGKQPPLELFSAPLLLLPLKKRHDIFIDHLLESLDEKLRGASQDFVKDVDTINNHTGVPVPATGGAKLVSQKPEGGYATYKFVPPPGKEGAYFQRLLQTLQDDKVQVALVLLPDFQGTNESNRQLGRFRKHLKSLQKTFPNVAVLDYNAPDRFDLSDPALFLDGGWGKSNCHLSAAGTKALSPLLCRDLERLMR